LAEIVFGAVKMYDQFYSYDIDEESYDLIFILLGICDRAS